MDDFFIAQAALIATNRPDIHRRLGYWGAALASTMVVLGVAVAFRAERLGHKPALAPDPETNFLFSLGDILTFAIFIAAGFLWRRKREAHQRLMLLAVVAGLFDAVPPRLPLIGGHPAGMAIVGLLFLLAGPIYDLVSAAGPSGIHFWMRFRIAHRATPSDRVWCYTRLAPYRQMASRLMKNWDPI